MPPDTPPSPAPEYDGWATLKRFVPYLWPRDRKDLRLRIAAALVLVLCAKAITLVAESVGHPGGIEAVNLKVAEQYIEAFGNVAREGNTLILPANLADVGGLIATAMAVVKGGGKVA